MITLNEIEKEISSLIMEAQSEPKKSKAKRLMDRVAILKTCKMYIESSPDSDFIEKEKQRVKNRVQLIMDGFKDYTSRELNDKKRLSEYKKMFNVSQLNSQIKILSMLSK